MANIIIPKLKEKMLQGASPVNWTADTIKVVLLDTALYTIAPSTDEFLSDIPAGARVATSSALTTKTQALGVCDADDVTYSSVTGATVEAFMIYKDTGVDATSPLIAYFDTATGLVFTPNSGGATITWDNGASKILAL